MAGENRPVRQIGEKLIADAGFRVFRLAFHRQPQTEKAVTKPALGSFEFCPCHLVTVDREIGDIRVRRHEAQKWFNSSTGTAQLQTL
jgi:hypothetical protein